MGGALYESLTRPGPRGAKPVPGRPHEVLPYSRGGISNPMHSFRPFALLLAIALPAVPHVLAQAPDSTSANPAQDQTQGSSSSAAGQAQQSAAETAGQLSVQQRIGQRREQRRATAIHDAYDHKWELDAGTGYLRFQPGPYLQRLTYYAWDVGADPVPQRAARLHARRPRILRIRVCRREPIQSGRFHPARDQHVQRARAVPFIAFICNPSTPSLAACWADGRMATLAATSAPLPQLNWPLSRRQHLCGQRQCHRRIQSARRLSASSSRLSISLLVSGRRFKPAEDSRAEWWSGGGNSKNSSQFVVHRSPSLFSVHSSHSPYVPSP